MCGKGPVGGASLMVFLSLVVYLVAFVAPGWAVGPNSYLGLWQACNTTGNSSSCMFAKDFYGDDGQWLFITEVTGSLSLFAMLLASVLAVVTLRRSSIGNIFFVAGMAFLTLLGGGCMMATLAVFGMNIEDEKTLSYCFYITVVAAVLSFISTLLDCIYMKCPSYYDDELPLVHDPSEVH